MSKGSTRLVGRRYTARVRLALVIAFVLAALASPARAQLRRDTRGAPLPAVSTAAPRGAFALEANPAALAYLPGWEVAWVHAEAHGADRLPDEGDSLYAATPLPFRRAAAASADWVRPENTGEAERGRFSLGLAWARSRHLAVGGAVRFFGSDDPVGGVATVDLGATFRPAPFLAMGVVVHDVLGPPGLVGGDAIPATFDAGVQLRPFATDQLLFEVMTAVDTDGRVGVRGLAGVEVPRVGRLYGALEGDDLRGDGELRALVGLDLRWDRFTVGGGALLGDGLGAGWLASARVAEVGAEAALPSRGWVDEIRVRGVGARTLLGLLARLDRDRHTPGVRGVLLTLRETDMGLAYAQELRQAIAALRAAGKPVVCHLDGASGSEIYACAAADRTYLDPAGFVRLLGPSLDVTLYGELLRDLGVRTDFIRIGRFKSAVESYANDAMSDPAREARETFLDDVWARLLRDLAADRETEPERVARWIDEGPYLAEEASALGLTTGESAARRLGDALEELTGTRRRRREPERTAPTHFGRPRRLGVIVVDGAMVDGENVDLPIVEIHQSGGETVAKAIDAMAADRSIAAIVLRVDSPGGSALASDQIWRALRRARRRKPVIASMGAMAASGGYYVASAADEIYADPSTLTGSIGVFFGKVDAEPLAERLGVEVTQLSRGAHAGATSLFRPFTPEERASLADLVRQSYRLFLRRVAEGRGMSVREVDAAGRGRIWSGDAARELGLVDHLGGFLAAVERARELARLPADAPIVVAPDRPRSLADYVLGPLGLPTGRVQGGLATPDASGGPLPIPPRLRHALVLGAALGGTREGAPMAMLPAAITLE